jgi:hypothetical protein
MLIASFRWPVVSHTKVGYPTCAVCFLGAPQRARDQFGEPAAQVRVMSALSQRRTSAHAIYEQPSEPRFGTETDIPRYLPVNITIQTLRLLIGAVFLFVSGRIVARRVIVGLDFIL